ncbi:hypothetical protein FKP32DRAFT_1670602 [Trametes sanguinea]|nr:hypothetical protein FKP32DRAFT_1674479 [Trametes sanguinea]KAI9070145.1 hypothetical protein FKP32DRAFT_1670602 [Trametes sanguinea]
MHSCAAPGCTATFNRKIGLGIHRLTCKHRFAAFTKILPSNAEVSSGSEDEGPPRKRHKQVAEAIESPEPLVAPSPPESPAPTRTRSGRAVRVPKRFEDFVPSNIDELPSHVTAAFPEAAPMPSPTRYQSPTVEDSEEDDEDVWELPPDAFGVYRMYTTPVQRDPEAYRQASDQASSDAPVPDNDPRYTNVSWLTPNSAFDNDSTETHSTALGPFPNCSQFRLTDWWHNASLTKSQEDFNDLLDLLRSPAAR